MLADINEESYSRISSRLEPARTLFQRADVSSWEDNALLFKRAFQWQSDQDSEGEGEGKGRIDFFAANAGINDQESVFAQFNLDAEPEKPNVKAVEVDLLAAIYGLKLFLHYARKTRGQAPAPASFTPAMIITASSAGLYPFPVNPQYCAAKHGLVGLTRSVGGRLLAQDNVSVNAIMPGLVSTGMTPPWMMALCPQEYLTPISTILRAYDDLMEEETVGGSVKRKTGKCLEAAQAELYYRDMVEFPSDGQRWLFDTGTEGGFLKMIEQYAMRNSWL